MKDYLLTAQEVLKSQKSGESGLSAAEAASRLERDGKNKLAEAKKDSLLKKFFDELKEPMLIILMVAAVLSVITSAASGEVEFTDAIIILVVVLLNAILGVLQESKAEKAIEALQQMSAATSKVIRDGKQLTVHSEDLVAGDVVVLEAGDAVPADGRIIECASMKIEEAALTGESVPVDKQTEKLYSDEDKDVPLGDRKNMVYMGSTVVYGRGKAVITGTGMNTEMGKIASAISEAKEELTPLQIKLNQLSKILTYLVLGICVVIFAIDIIRIYFTTGTLAFSSLLDTFMVAISLAVAAIPEGLAAVVTIVLSIGVTKMSKNNAIIRKLTAVETLGCTQVICSDKTGTLTQNKMTVVDSWSDNEELLARAMALCSDSKLDDSNNAIGEPTECALVNYAFKLGINKNELEAGPYRRVGEAPFDSSRKMMSTVHTDNGQEDFVQYTKGAPDEILKKCTSILRDGKIVPLTDKDKDEILAKNKEFADRALRVLAASFRDWEAEPVNYDAKYVEENLTFIGLVGMIDPIRPEVKVAVEECKSAGIHVVMITGDHKDTAVAIAKELGIISGADEATTGSTLDGMSDEELDKMIEHYSVYARVQPEHKVRIVQAWKRKGRVTAMTGDGVNDAPSIKNADIGVGMGITGTDVTKNVADMVLADDNFATIVQAVAEGRKIYDNIRKAIQFLLGSNMAEVIAIFVSSILGFTILKPSHLLWINLITDCFPAIGLGMEKGESDIMTRQPRSKNEGIFAGGVGVNCFIQGFAVALITLISYFIGEYIQNGAFHIADSTDGMTMAFLTLSMAELFHSFNMRSLDKSLFSLKGHNKYLLYSMLGSFVLTICVLYIPFLRDAFSFEHISLFEFAVALIMAFLIIPVVEIQKFIQRKIAKNRKN